MGDGNGDGDIMAMVATLKTRIDYLEKEIMEIKSSIREINIVTKYVMPVLLALIAIISALR